MPAPPFGLRREQMNSPLWPAPVARLYPSRREALPGAREVSRRGAPTPAVSADN